jgi:glycosyltransferase involved in cell wall biosynthesis
MKKKKVLYVITKSNWGGAQRYVFDLATHLPKDQFEVAVAFGQRGLLAEKLEGAKIKTHYLSTMQRNVAVLKDVRAFFELYRLFKKERPDVVHLNSSKAGGVGALAARLSGVPNIIFTAHGWPFWEPRTVVARGLIWLASWGTVLLSHKTIVISDYDKRVAQHMPFCKNKIVRIYNGIDLHMQFGPGDIIRGAFPAGVKITGTVGELTANKNQDALIEQARADKNRYVAIVGEGELRQALEVKILKYGLVERVKLFGFLPAADVLKGFDVFALPSLKEGLPYVLLEARAAGLPIAANRVGGVSEILGAKDLSEFSVEKMVARTAALYTRS